MTELSIILQKQVLSQYSFVCCFLALLLTLLCVLYNHYCPHFLPDVKHVQVVSNNKAKACLALQPSGAECMLGVGSLILTFQVCKSTKTVQELIADVCNKSDLLLRDSTKKVGYLKHRIIESFWFERTSKVIEPSHGHEHPKKYFVLEH